ncbi:MAG: hypothetical protein GY812_17605 [Actinomycetia bacterium]|nr:hypothetical protein [Actinomycetes bacterium]
MTARLWAAIWVAVVSLVALAPLAAAQDDDSGAPAVLRVETVDSRGESWTATGVSESALPTVSAEGEELAASSSDVATDVVVVIDNDRALPNGVLQLSGNAAEQFLVPGVGAVRRVAVVSTAREGARQEIGFSSEPEVVRSAINGVSADGDAATWDALARAADLLEGSDASSKRVVAYLSAANKLSRTTPGAAATALRLAEAQLDVMAMPAGVNTTQLADTVLDTGGTMQVLGSDEEFAPQTEAVVDQINNQFIVNFPAPAGDAEQVQLDFTAGEAAQSVQVGRGALTAGASNLVVSQASLGLLDSIITNSMAKWLFVVLIAAAVVGFLWALLTMVLPDSDNLARRLRAYDDAPEGGEEEAEHQGVATVPLLQRAVELTGDVAEKRGFLESLEISLERANLPLRAAEAVFFLAVSGLLLGIGAFAVTGNILVALVVLGVAFMVPKTMLDMRVRKRQKVFVAQLPDMLALLAGTLKAGYSITQGFEAVSREVEDPMGMELRRVVTEHRLGRTLEDALDATADRMGSEDFAWTVMAIKIQREVGGNLAELLMTVANTMTQRERLRRDVNSLTAEGRISAFILGLLPPGLALVMYVMNRDYIMTLFSQTLGYFIIGVALVAMAIGFAWMKKIITIEV